MFGRFLREEKAQGAIEYILLAGGIIVAAVVIFAIYSRMTKSAGNKLEKATGVATTAMQEEIEAKAANMTV
ncbi:MAG: Flp family type IVb pilin [Candidatus Hydrothermarchaeales archaeon]